MKLTIYTSQIIVPAAFFWLFCQFSAMAFQEIKQTEETGIVEIISTGMNFEAPTSIPPGWTTFRYINNSPDIHFFVLGKMPAGKTIEDTKSEIIPVFSRAMDLISTGNAEQGFAVFDELPPWFFDVELTGGPGLISPGRIAETTLELEPGTYVLECYIKMPNGQFHSALGMIAQIIVSGESNRNNPPLPTGEITISSERGIEFKGSVLPGPHTFAVHFEDQTAHEHFMGHDVHVVKIESGTDLAVVNSWMNWADPSGFSTPSPQGVTFLGGTQEMPEGSTAYIHVEITPGNYAFIAEVPDPQSKNMFLLFSVLPKRK